MNSGASTSVSVESSLSTGHPTVRLIKHVAILSGMSSQRIPNSLSKELLVELYWNQNLKPSQIAQQNGLMSERSVRKRMERFGIPRRTVSEALTRKLKRPFDGTDSEKAYLLGLRAGDFHAKRIKQCIRLQTSTTHPAQVQLLHDALCKYGELRQYLYIPKERQREWFIYVDLHKSFEFLIQKPMHIPEWILNDEICFAAFLSAYIDCEGNWHVSRSHEKIRCTFRLRSSDKELLDDVSRKLIGMGYTPKTYLERKKGTKIGYGSLTNDFFGLIINKRVDVLRIINFLKPNSRHDEKTKQMRFIQENTGKKYETAIMMWREIRKRINEERLDK
jgi:hypothetical protein